MKNSDILKTVGFGLNEVAKLTTLPIPGMPALVPLGLTKLGEAANNFGKYIEQYERQPMPALLNLEAIDEGWVEVERSDAEPDTDDTDDSLEAPEGAGEGAAASAGAGEGGAVPLDEPEQGNVAQELANAIFGAGAGLAALDMANAGQEVVPNFDDGAFEEIPLTPVVGATIDDIGDTL